MGQLIWGATTHAGAGRAVNQDAHLTRPPVFAVADGMGGHVAGDRASALVIATLAELIPEVPNREQVLHAIRQADARLVQAAQATGAVGMGTTLCLLALLGPRLVLVANVGDSRAYRVGPLGLEQLTHDHSVVQELIDAGHLDTEAAEHHPERHIITRSLGSGAPLDIDWWLIETHPDDTFVLASDGLTKVLPIATIEDRLHTAPDPGAAATQLVADVVAAGGRDDATAVVLHIGDAPGDERERDPLDADTNPALGVR